MSAHRTPEEIRKRLKHPVIDGDGHWVEYTPVFGERIRKAVGSMHGQASPFLTATLLRSLSSATSSDLSRIT